MRLKSKRTIYGLALETCLLTNIPYRPLPNTTLNEFFNRQVSDETNENFSIKYFMLGMAVNGIEDLELYKEIHIPEHANVYKPIPLIVRPFFNKLTKEEASKYRMQVNKNIDGIDYIFYFLKELTDLNKPAELLSLSFKKEGFKEIDIKNFNNNKAGILNPSLDDIANSSEDIFHTVTKTVTVLVNKDEKHELLDATKLYYDLQDTEGIKISEIALVHGRDIKTNVNVEVKDAQVSFFLNTTDLLEIYSDLEPIDLTVNLGGLEMMKG